MEAEGPMHHLKRLLLRIKTIRRAVGTRRLRIVSTYAVLVDEVGAASEDSHPSNTVNGGTQSSGSRAIIANSNVYKCAAGDMPRAYAGIKIIICGLIVDIVSTYQ